MAKHRKDTKEDEKDYNRLNFLKQRLSSMRVQMLITERYRNQTLNHEYKDIVKDLLLYGKYFLILICVVVLPRDQLMYYNTAKMKYLLMRNHSEYIGLKEINHLNQLFDFVKSSLVDAFNEGTSEGASWVHSEQNKILGVVRLRQLRLAKEDFGWGVPKFTDLMYMPGWKLPYQRLLYTHKYWRVYDPWLPINGQHDFTSSVLLNFDHVGKFLYYPELCGYVALLARSRQNSMKILDFLTDNQWLNYNTSAVFMDFTLYNVDADMFSVCTLRMEQLPFGSVIPDVTCESIAMINDALQLHYIVILVLVVYLVVVLQFIQAFIVNLWYQPDKLKSMWYKLDLIIVLLNVFLLFVIIVRLILISSLLKSLAFSNKMSFLDFRKPARLYMLTNILTGFLICITTLRLWKVLQFSKVFQLFTNTLYLAWKALAITALAILIILMAFGIAFTIINGNNSPHFVQPVSSVITALCFSVGFSQQLNPSDLFHGGKFIGMLMYAALGFVVSVLLVNVFITTIHDYFTIAKSERNANFRREITFWQFLRVEYYGVYRFYKSLPFIRKEYKRHNRTVAENIQHTLDNVDKLAQMKARAKRRVLSSTEKVEEYKDEETRQAEYRERVEHMYAIASILNIQMEILERLIFDSDKKKKRERKKNRRDQNPMQNNREGFNDKNDSVV
ncbi:polycystin-2-like [Drosophila grimshawi]|uniref:GH14404 n=2 Tax=Drosophila grimshawi TaxID=7222 RepID=B4J1A3_DROGR|nr:polycystin-2-like [Drosophila grimshawi]EDV97972.1 GH14404 [Drosophila grimshawi]